MRLLLLGHGAERTGPPIHMARLVRWAARETTDTLAVVLAAGGPLLEEISAGSTCQVPGMVAGHNLRALPEAAANRAFGPSGGRQVRALSARQAIRSMGAVDAVYLNGITGPGTELLAEVDVAVPVVTHVHELGIGFDRTTSPDGLELIRSRTDRFIAVSDAVAALVADRFAVADELIPRAAALLPDPLPEPTSDGRQAARVQLGVEDDSFVVGACGLRDWRKAPELFLRLAWDVARKQPDKRIEFRWIGGEGPNDWQLDHEARALGVSDQLSFINEVADTSSLFVGLDAFAVTAREDAYPLAALEAAAVGVPLVAFDTGGIVEFIGSDAGRVCAPGDTEAMADVVIEMALDPGFAAQLSAGARTAAVTRHDPSRSAQRLWSLITEVGSK